MELSAKLVELSHAQARVEVLSLERAELESVHLQKTAELELKLKEIEESGRFMSDRVEELVREKEGLALDNLEKEKKISDLTKKIHKIELDRIDLQVQLKKLTEEKPVSYSSGARETPYRKHNDSVVSAAGEFAETPQIDPVKLGKIVVQKSSGYAARVERVDVVYGFIVVNAGTRDGLKNGTVLNVIRDKRLIGRAVVEKARDKTSAAILLPEWTTEKVEAGDFVSKF
jgi:hypothetical protein